MANILRRRDTADELMSPRMLQREIDRLFDDFFGLTGGPSQRSFVPQLELAERDGEYVMKAELPGLDERDVKLEVDDSNILTIRGEKKSELEETKSGYCYSERSYGQFVRSIQLPSTVDSSKIDASFKNGVLELRIPKSEKMKPRNIPIGCEPKSKS
jgi:HSP20 family protein